MGNEITRNFNDNDDTSRSLSIKELANELINKDILYPRPGSTIERVVQSHRQTKLRLSNKNINYYDYNTPMKITSNENITPMTNTPNNLSKGDAKLFSPIKLIDQINNVPPSPNDFIATDTSSVKLPELVIKPSFARPRSASQSSDISVLAQPIQVRSNLAPNLSPEGDLSPLKKSTTAAFVASRRRASPLTKSQIHIVAPTEIKITTSNLLKFDASSKVESNNVQNHSPLSEGSEPPSPQPKYPTFESADPSLFSKSPATFQKSIPYESPIVFNCLDIYIIFS